MGFEPDMRPCAKLSESSQVPPYNGRETPFPFPHPISIVVVCRGTGRFDDTWDANPVLDSFRSLQEPNKKLVIFLVEEGVDPEMLAAIKSNGYEVIKYPEDYVAGVADKVANRLKSFEGTLRTSPKKYQDQKVVDATINITNLVSRTYVWETGFGIVEIRFDIPVANLPRDAGEFHRFRHRIAIRDPQSRLGIHFEGDLKKYEAKSVADIFSLTRESIGAIRFGKTPLSIGWEEIESTGNPSLERDIEIRIPANSLDPCEILSYGYIWSRPNLFDPRKDTSALRFQYNVQRYEQSVCFMRSLLNRWDFKRGPLLQRFGPYNNNLGYLDHENICTNEEFHHFDYNWMSTKIARGSVFIVEWELHGNR
jgi:hypothetical protein